jgi:hypothetical protein
VRATAEWAYYLPTREDVWLPFPEGFAELFDAARVLLEEGAPENQVIPTLALAHHLCHGVPRLVAEKKRFETLQGDEQAWAEEADRFARRFGGLWPLRITQGTLILERRPVLIAVGYALAQETPLDVVVTVYPHRTPLATSAEVASLYDKALSEAGIPHDNKIGHLDFAYFNSRLEITIRPGVVTERATITEGVTVPQAGWRSDVASFPRPRYVGALCEALVATESAEGFKSALPNRRRSRPPKTENLVPACVVYLLREYGIQPDKEINGPLYRYVLAGTWKTDHPPHKVGQFKNADRGSSLHEQVWGNSRKEFLVGKPLIDAAWTLFWEGDE